jgi:hypothetical protein
MFPIVTGTDFLEERDGPRFKTVHLHRPATRAVLTGTTHFPYARASIVITIKSELSNRSKDMKHGETPINHRHPLRAQDAVVISELRAASAEHKGDLIGPEIRVNPDAEMAAAPPAPQGVRYQRDSVAGVPGW